MPRMKSLKTILRKRRIWAGIVGPQKRSLWFPKRVWFHPVKSWISRWEIYGIMIMICTSSFGKIDNLLLIMTGRLATATGGVRKIWR